MNSIVEIKNLSKVYEGGFKALNQISLNIKEGEIFALLGANGAGKTTLISAICGLLKYTDGEILVGGKDILSHYRESRSLIGLVPQELATDAFESVWNTVSFSRGLFNKPKNDAYIEDILKKLSLWDKRNNRIMSLSGGMKRRVMIAKALSHEPKILFLDEPTAGVDVELRKDMWNQVNELRKTGVTILLTTHYIEEAEAMADRIGVIAKGEILLVEEKTKLLKNLGNKQIRISFKDPFSSIPEVLKDYPLTIDQSDLVYTFDSNDSGRNIQGLFKTLSENNFEFIDLCSKQRNLEEIFVDLVREHK